MHEDQLFDENSDEDVDICTDDSNSQGQQNELGHLQIFCLEQGSDMEGQ